jgi:hypothetical protein
MKYLYFKFLYFTKKKLYPYPIGNETRVLD